MSQVDAVPPQGVRIACRIGHRTIDFPDGRRLTIRPTTGADVDGLARLYEQLPQEDLYSRFFSMYHPPRSFYERQAGLAESGGCALVAIVSGADRIVADAGFELLPDGGAEFALTVAPEWRGWLGPYLLDSLVEVAAARGVPNLQADVLTTNHRMLAPLHRRAYALIGNGDYSVTRAAVATTGSMPFWPRHQGAPRVVAEVPGFRWAAERDGLRAHWQVIGCGQPRLAGKHGCPALKGEPCPLALSADVVVVGFPAEAQGAALLAAHEQLHPGVPAIPQTGNSDDELQTVTAIIRSILRTPPKGDTNVK